MKKSLKTKDIRFAIELEVEYPCKRDSFALIKKHRVIPGWNIDFDGSLNNGAEYIPKDKNKLFLNEDTKDQIKEILGLIKAHKGKVNTNCGTHCHINSTHFTTEELSNIVKATVKYQKQIVKYFKVKKNRLGHTCQYIPKKIGKYINSEIISVMRSQESYSLEDLGDANEYLNGRYYILNLTALSKHNTLEWRLFNGTLNFDTIIRNVKWAINFCLFYRNANNLNKKVKF